MKINKDILLQSAGAVLLLSVLAIILSISGCLNSYTDEDKEGNAQIAVVWSESPSARPVRFLFYDEDGSLVRDERGVKYGFSGTLPIGSYHLLVISEDARNVEYVGLGNYSTAEVFTKFSLDGSIRQPHSVYCARTCNESDMVEIIADETTILSVTPKSLVRQLKLYFNVEGDKEIRSITGSIDGVSSELYLSSGMPEAENSHKVQFSSVQETKSPMNFMATIEVFDIMCKAHDSLCPHNVDLTITDAEGNSYVGTFDMKEVFHSAVNGNQGVIPAELTMSVDLKLSEMNGFSVTVEMWEQDDKFINI